MDLTCFKWIRQPKSYHIDNNRVEIVTAPHTDLWKITDCNNYFSLAPLIKNETNAKY